MSIQAPIVGLPGFGSVRTSAHRLIFRDAQISGFLSGGKIISGAASRDPGNTGNLDVLRSGLIMGKITSGGKYAPSILGVTTGALLTGGTTVSASAATVTELVRRIGATGTFKITGPPAASGTVRTLTATYSAASGTSITITALGVNEVQTVNLVTAGTGGNLRLIVPKPDGTLALTPNIAWSATDATLLGNANTALDTATGVTGGLVATAIAATDTDLGFVVTFAGTGYAGLTGPTSGGSWPLIEVHTLFTSNTGANVVRTTTGVSGAMIAGSFIQPVDGSENPVTFIPDMDGFGLKVTDLDSASVDRDFPLMPTAGTIITANFLPAYPSDASLKTWLKESLSTLAAGKYVFDDEF